MKTPILAVALGLALGAAVPSSTFAAQPASPATATVRDTPQQHDGHHNRRRQQRQRRGQEHRHGHHVPAAKH